MSPPEPQFSSRTVRLCGLLGESVVWWFAYLTGHESALALNLGGQTGTLRNLVEHIVQVEEFFAGRLLEQEPAEKPEDPGLAGLLRMHKDAKEKFETFLDASDDDKLRDMQMVGSRKVSNRKMLAQAAPDSVHHWAQIATEVRQAGFPTAKPPDSIITDVME